MIILLCIKCIVFCKFIGGETTHHRCLVSLSLASVGKCFYQLLVIETFRPDHLLAMGNRFVAMVMGKNFMLAAEQELNLATIIKEKVN